MWKIIAVLAVLFLIPTVSAESAYTTVDFTAYFAVGSPVLIWGGDTPDNNENITGCYAFFAMVGDEILTSCNMSINGVNYTMTPAGYTCYLNVTIGTNGTYVFNGTAWDTWNRTNMTETRTFNLNCSTTSTVCAGGTGGSVSYSGVDKAYICPGAGEADYSIDIALIILIIIAIIVLFLVWRRRKKRKKSKGAKHGPT